MLATFHVYTFIGDGDHLRRNANGRCANTCSISRTLTRCLPVRPSIKRMVGRDYGEARVITIGLLRSRMVVLVWTPRGDVRHVMSMSKANEREKTRYRGKLTTYR